MIVGKIIPFYAWPRLNNRSPQCRLHYVMITHARKWKSYDSFKFRHVSDEQQPSSVHAEPASGCDINVCLKENPF